MTSGVLDRHLLRRAVEGRAPSAQHVARGSVRRPTNAAGRVEAGRLPGQLEEGPVQPGHRPQQHLPGLARRTSPLQRQVRKRLQGVWETIPVYIQVIPADWFGVQRHQECFGTNTFRRANTEWKISHFVMQRSKTRALRRQKLDRILRNLGVQGTKCCSYVA